MEVELTETFFITIFNRFTFEVTEEEYVSAMSTAFKWDPPINDGNKAYRISWHAGCMDGTYKKTNLKQAIEEVKVSANRT